MLPKTILSQTGMRGIAAFVVVIAHIVLMDWFIGADFVTNFAFRWHQQSVDLFFLLSGFILNHVYSNSDQINWKQFYKSRIARVFPLYYLTLFAFILLDLIFYQIAGRDSGRLDLLSITRSIFMVSVSGWFGTRGETAYNPASWSVCVEVFLYFAIFPIIFLTQKRVKGLLVHLVLIGSLSFGVSCAYLFDLPERYYFLTRGICGFMAGFYIRSLLRHYSFHPLIIRFVGITGLFFAALAIPNFIPRGTLPLAFPLIIFATAYDTGYFSQIMKLPVFQYLGDRSYSIYLWHLPIYELSRLLFLGNNIEPSHDYALGLKLWMFGSFFVLLFFIAELSYRYFELPMRNLIRKL